MLILRTLRKHFTKGKESYMTTLHGIAHFDFGGTCFGCPCWDSEDSWCRLGDVSTWGIDEHIDMLPECLLCIDND